MRRYGLDEGLLAAIGRFLQFMAVERNASDYTVKSYREDLAHLIHFFTESHGSCPSPGQLTTLDLRGYVATLHDAGYAKTTIARRLASLRSFFRFGQRDGWAASNPAKPLRNPRQPRSLPHFLSTEELGRLLESPPAGEPQGLRDRAILETMYSAGLRVSEVVGLDDDDVDRAGCVIRVRGKGKTRTALAARLVRLRRLGRMARRSPIGAVVAAMPRIHGCRSSSIARASG